MDEFPSDAVAPEASGTDSELMQWQLARQTAATPSIGLDATFAVIREVSKEEYREILAAEKLLESFGDKWGYSKADTAALAVADRLEKLRDGAARSGGQVNRADVQLLAESVRYFATQVTRYLEALPETPEGDLNLLPKSLQACQEVARSKKLGLSLISGPPEGQIGLAIRLTDPGMGDKTLDSWKLVKASMDAMLRYSDEQLAAASKDLAESGSFLMKYLAEVAYGRPVLIPNIQIGNEEATHQLELRPLRLDLVSPTLVAAEAARARQVARSKAGGPDDGGFAGAPEATTPDFTTDPDAEPEKSTEEKAPPATGQQTHSSPVDVELLLKEVVGISAETEVRWNQALSASLTDDFEALTGRLESAIGEMARAMMRRGEAAKADGYTDIMPRYPLDISGANAIELNPGGQVLITQEAIASVCAFELLTGCLKQLNAREPHIVDAERGVILAWWEQAVFERIRMSASFTARVLGLIETKQEGRIGADVARAVHAWQNGLPEAAALYVHRALRSGVNNPPESQSSLEKLDVSIDALAKGEHVPLSALVPLVDFWLRGLGWDSLEGGMYNLAETDGGTGA